jgi:hypothetical protein
LELIHKNIGVEVLRQAKVTTECWEHPMIRNIFLKIISMISSNYRKENFPKLNGQPNEQNDATKDCSTRKILAQKRIPSLLSLLLLPEAFPLIGCGKDLLVYVIVDRQIGVSEANKKHKIKSYEYN